MIRSKLGKMFREKVFPVFVVVFGFLCAWAFFTVFSVFAYHICRGWIIFTTGDVDFVPPVSALPPWAFPVIGLLELLAFIFSRVGGA